MKQTNKQTINPLYIKESARGMGGPYVAYFLVKVIWLFWKTEIDAN